MTKPGNNAYSQSGGITSLPSLIQEPRDPTNLDVNYPLNQLWKNTLTKEFFILTSFTSSSGTVLAIWNSQIGLDQTFTPDSGGVVSPDVAGNINLLGTVGLITTVGTPVANTITWVLDASVSNSFVADSGTATPAAHVLNILGTNVVAGTSPVRTTATGNTLTVNVQRSQAIAATDATKIGLCNFNSSMFSVDANGFVSLAGGGLAIDSIGTQTGTNPIVPTGAGLVTINGSVVGAGTNPVRSDGTGANTLAIEVQISQAIASTDKTVIGLSAFDSAVFTVDVNGFVSGSTTGFIKTLTGNSGTPVSPILNNINTVGTGSITISNSSNTLTTQLTGLTNHNVLIGAGTATITNVAPSSTSGVPLISQGAAADPAFGTAVVAGGGTGSTSFNINGVVISNTTTTGVLTSLTLTNGQMVIGSTGASPVAGTITSTDGSITVSSGAGTLNLAVAGGTTTGKTITGNSGGALSPTAGNWNILGTGSITTSGSGSTLTVQLTGLTNHAIQIGAGTATLTQLGAGTTGQVLQTNTTADPTWSTATYPSTTTINQILYSSASNTITGLATANQGVLTTGATGIPVITALAVNGQLIIGSTAGVPAAATLTAGTGISITNGSNSISIAVNGSVVGQTITGDTGGALSPTAGNWNLLGSGSITTSGSGSTLTTQLTGLTNHNVLIGAGTTTITKVAPSATSGVPLISQGSSSDPTFGTAVVAGGGTGLTTTTAYGVICGGTTATGNFQNAGAGTSGQILQSGGASALPSWVTPSSVGSWVLLSSQTASSSSALTFTSVISATYSTYVLIWSKSVPSTNGAVLEFQVSTNNGSSYIATNYQSGINVAVYNSATISNGNSTTLGILTSSTDSASSGSAGIVWFYNTQNSGTFLARGISNYLNGGNTNFGDVVCRNTATSVNAFQIFYNSGNISTGIFSLYGIRET